MELDGPLCAECGEPVPYESSHIVHVRPGMGNIYVHEECWNSARRIKDADAARLSGNGA